MFKIHNTRDIPITSGTCTGSLYSIVQEIHFASVNFMRVPTEMFDEILARVSQRITKQRNNYRRPIEPGMKLSIALRHLVSGSKYRDMRFGWRVPHNTISLLVLKISTA